MLYGIVMMFFFIINPIGFILGAIGLAMFGPVGAGIGYFLPIIVLGMLSG